MERSNETFGRGVTRRSQNHGSVTPMGRGPGARLRAILGLRSFDFQMGKIVVPPGTLITASPDGVLMREMFYNCLKI